MSKIVAAILLVVALVVFSDATNVRKCKNGQPFPLNVDVKGCEEPPCNVVKGTTVVMDVHFVGSKNGINSMEAKVKASALGITLPYDLPKDVADVCSNLLDGATCPIDKGEDVIYNFNFEVDSHYPEIPVSVEVSIIDVYKDALACFVCEIKVVPK